MFAGEVKHFLKFLFEVVEGSVSIGGHEDVISFKDGDGKVFIPFPNKNPVINTGGGHSSFLKFATEEFVPAMTCILCALNAMKALDN